MSAEDVIRLLHMLQAAQTALEFAEDQTRQSLDSNLMLVFALIRAVEIIGEAASKLSAELQTANPQIPWRAIVGMRNRLVHGYFDVDLDEVWSTITRDLPILIAQIEPLMGSNPDD
jgi:uncharacterized protein with HEPN domain